MCFGGDSFLKRGVSHGHCMKSKPYILWVTSESWGRVIKLYWEYLMFFYNFSSFEIPSILPFLCIHRIHSFPHKENSLNWALAVLWARLFLISPSLLLYSSHRSILRINSPQLLFPRLIAMRDKRLTVLPCPTSCFPSSYLTFPSHLIPSKIFIRRF